MKCEHCQKEFKPTVSWQKFCSKQCTTRNACKRYYYRNHKEQKKRSLISYHERKKTENGLNKIRENNYKANSKRRFGIEDRRKFIHSRGNKCEWCGTTNKKLYIHHKDHNGRGKKTPNNDVNNLLVVCSSCHNKYHHTKNENR